MYMPTCVIHFMSIYLYIYFSLSLSLHIIICVCLQHLCPTSGAEKWTCCVGCPDQSE